MPIKIEDSQDNISETSLTLSERAKLKKILATIKGATDERGDRDEMKAIIAEDEVDKTPDLIEGIFICDTSTNIFVRWFCNKCKVSPKP